MDIQDYTSKYTKEEFLELAKSTDFICPNHYKLEDININQCEDGKEVICLKCWDKALKDIEFKN